MRNSTPKRSRRELGARTTFTRNPRWWGRFDGNVRPVMTLNNFVQVTRIRID